MRNGERTAAQYDARATAHDADTAQHAINAFSERPATIELLGEVGARRALDGGCGASPER